MTPLNKLSLSTSKPIESNPYPNLSVKQINLMNDLNALYKGVLYRRKISNDAIRIGRLHDIDKATMLSLKSTRRNQDIMIGALAKLCLLVETDQLSDNCLSDITNQYNIFLKEYQTTNLMETNDLS